MSVDRPLSRIARLGGLIAVCAVAALLVALGAPSRADASVRCAGTFRVLHDDRVGRLELSAGSYRITILASGTPTCAQASGLFSRFLEDFDGVLPGGWRVAAAGSAFVRAPGVGFRVARVGRGGGGGGGEEESGGGGVHPRGGTSCPTFRVLNNDRIGSLRLPRGPYQVILLQRRGLTCPQASALFSRFLLRYEGFLPPPWVLEPHTATFRRGAGGAAFRVKPA